MNGHKKIKRFLSFVQKEFYHIFRDKRTLLIILVMPIVQIILFGFALNTELKNINIAVLDPSQDEASKRIVNQLSASSYFNLYGYVDNVEQINDLFLKGKVDLVVVFSENFHESALHTGDASIQIISDASNTNTATMSIFYASNIISSYRQELALEKELQSTKISSPPAQIVPIIKMLYNPRLKSSYTFVPGVMGMILMLICAMMTAVSIVREKERGTMELLLVSPTKPLVIVTAKTVPYLVISIVNLITILLLSVFLLKVPITGSIGWLFVISSIFIVVSLSLGMFFSSLVKTQVTAILASALGLMLPTMLLSGLIFPIEGMPLLLQWISYIVPASWYIDSVKTIMIQGLGIKYALNDLLVLLSMAVVFLSVSLLSFRKR